MSNNWNREAIVEIIDAACWSARKFFGHDDNGLDEYGVGLDGTVPPHLNDDGSRNYEETYHPSAVDAADKILALVDEETEQGDPG